MEGWAGVLPLLVLFSLVSSAGYVVNDVLNREEDRAHPRKKKRPVASGELPVKRALWLVFFLYTVSAVMGWCAYGWSPPLYCVLGYVALNLGYSFYLRKVPVLDLFTISLGFVLRVSAGAYAIKVAPSEWLMVLTYLLALLLGLGKRKGELRFIDKSAVEVGTTRGALRGYQGDLSSIAVILVAVGCFVAYCLYCVIVQQGFPFILTAVPVAVALSSYVRSAGRSDEVEVPEKMLLQKSSILAAFLIWVIMIGLMVY